MEPNDFILALRRLPQCVALATWPGGGFAPGRQTGVTMNVLNGLVVAVHIEAVGFMKMNDRSTLVLGGNAAAASSLDDAAAHALLNAWSGQARAAGLVT